VRLGQRRGCPNRAADGRAGLLSPRRIWRPGLFLSIFPIWPARIRLSGAIFKMRLRDKAWPLSSGGRAGLSVASHSVAWQLGLSEWCGGPVFFVPPTSPCPIHSKILCEAAGFVARGAHSCPCDHIGERSIANASGTDLASTPYPFRNIGVSSRSLSLPVIGMGMSGISVLLSVLVGIKRLGLWRAVACRGAPA